MKLLKNEINRKGSPSWLLCNDNSRASTFRSMFVNENGGEFTKNGKVWEWSDAPKIDPETIIEGKKYIFADATGREYYIDNITEFANRHDLSRAKIYDLMKGDRKTHKGFVFVKKIEIENPA